MNRDRFARAHLGDLDAPVEQPLSPDAVAVVPHVVQQAAVGHQLSDQLDARGQADAQQTAHVRVIHARHHVRLLHAHTHSGCQLPSYYYLDMLPPMKPYNYPNVQRFKDFTAFEFLLSTFDAFVLLHISFFWVLLSVFILLEFFSLICLDSFV